MNKNEQTLLDRVNANNWAELYRCRWSKSDAARVVPQLAGLLKSRDPLIVNESLRALLRIGTPAISVAPVVAKLTRSRLPMTKRLALLTLGQIAHKKSTICVKPLAMALTDPLCCRDALRSLAFMGEQAIGALKFVKPLLIDSDAKVRKSAVVTVAAIGGKNPEIMELLSSASTDRNKSVREAACKCLRTLESG